MTLLKTFLLLWQKLNWQNLSICKCELFLTLMWKTFCHLVGANSIENNLRACNSWTGRSVSCKVNWFWLNLPNQNRKMFSTSTVKNNSHLQMDIFYHLDFCHSRKNGFWAVKSAIRFMLGAFFLLSILWILAPLIDILLALIFTGDFFQETKVLNNLSLASNDDWNFWLLEWFGFRRILHNFETCL